MKKVLITGANSYIGTSFEKYVKEYNVDFEIDTLDLLDPNWKNYDFSGYDSIFHVAGIAHVSEKEISEQMYDEVNRELAVDVAKIVKKSGVGHFIFMSSMSIYGVNTGHITSSTVPNPNTKYGVSKWNAELDLIKQTSDDFILSIIRPPMVYGKESRGNFSRLLKLVKWVPIFPKIQNQRSMIHITNLSNFISLVIQYKIEGILFPQNAEYVSTVEMVETISTILGKSIYFLNLPLSNSIINRIPIVNKIFGSLTYDQSMSTIQSSNGRNIDYCLCNFKDSLKESVL
ncbi:TPA: NAD-dependent epimerase/dehydratase family protein [Streptococcus suis]